MFWIKRKKVFQLYKYSIWINLLYNITNLIHSAKGNAKIPFQELLNKIKVNYNFLDYTCKTIFIVVCNGNREKFNALKDANINDKQSKIKYLKELTEECNNRYNVYCDYYSFQYDDNSEMINQYEKEKAARENDKMEYLRQKKDYKDKIDQYKREQEK